MFPSSNNHELFPYTSKTFLERSFTYDHQNPSSSSRVQEDHSFFLNFPSPFLDHHESPLSQILPHQNQDQEPSDHHHAKEGNFTHISSETSKEEMSIEAKTSSKKRNLSITPRRRTGKKDRHSKICTAQGVRDRRVRLSLHIARKFFDLQDMLGFDKASKTIQWLFSKSNNAIKELSQNYTPLQKEYSHDGNNKNIIISSNNSSSSEGKSDSLNMSECEENSINEGKEKEKISEIMVNNKRNSREKARERARKRTKEKLMIKNLGNPNNNNIFDQLGSSRSNSGFLDQDSNNNSYNNTSVNQEKGSPHEANSQSLEHNHFSIQNYLGGASNPFMSFLGNWEINYTPMKSSTYSTTPFAGNPSSSYHQFQPLDQEKNLS